MADSEDVKALAAEAGVLARQLGKAYADEVEFYRKRMKLTPAEAERQATELTNEVERERVLLGPPRELTWLDLSKLAGDDPQAVAAAWEGIKDAARAELASGHTAASATDWDDSPWERAMLLAVRESFAAQWQPAGGAEDALIDMMAQAYVCYLQWLRRLSVMAEREGRNIEYGVKERGYWRLPHFGEAQAVEQAGIMADRFNRLFLRTLRALRDLRRYAPNVVIASAGQVNIGEKQVNVMGDRQTDEVATVGEAPAVEVVEAAPSAASARALPPPRGSGTRRPRRKASRGKTDTPVGGS